MILRSCVYAHRSLQSFFFSLFIFFSFDFHPFTNANTDVFKFSFDFYDRQTLDLFSAVVGRAVKFLGTPLITTGGFTFDFTEQKKECKDEYFMTTRVGNLAFRDIAQFLIAIIK